MTTFSATLQHLCSTAFYGKFRYINVGENLRKASPHFLPNSATLGFKSLTD